MKTPILALVFALAGFVTAPAQAALITLNAPSAVTGSFDVTVSVTGVFDAPHDGGDALFGYGFDVGFDPAIVTYAGETAGPLFDDISNNPGFGAMVGGTADAGLLFPGDFTEPLTLAVLHFDVAGVGPTSISITGDSSNLDQGLQYLSSSDDISASTGLTASASTSAPEPGTFLLAGLAGAGLLALRARRRQAR